MVKLLHYLEKKTSGEMHGLIRVRQFTLADGHLIVIQNN